MNYTEKKKNPPYPPFSKGGNSNIPFSKGDFTGLNCPLPIKNNKTIQMAHGSGGSLTDELVSGLFLSRFNNSELHKRHDGAILNINGSRIAFTTDSYVINPPFFPGGDIGKLAVCGTINDLAVCGAKPLYISAGFIIEEGLSFEELSRIVDSMQTTAEKAGVEIVTGDTKVVEKGKGDKIFINTSGIGIVYPGADINAKNCRAGDIIIINGSIAEHGIATISSRGGFEFETNIISDCAPLNDLVEKILAATPNVKMMRDATRGGLAGILNEISQASELGIFIEENKIPISEPVRGICEILGFDPLYIANEGKLIVIVSPGDAVKVLEVMKSHLLGIDSEIIGEITEANPGRVVLRTMLGSTRTIDMIAGEQFPRIC